jgi:CheY-like chemotaxis protein
MVSQNRNVQFFQKPTYLLPVTYAQAATWLRDSGHEVLWDDGNSQLKSFNVWFDDLIAWKPDVVVFESTTPVMKFYWATVDKLKEQLPTTIVIMTGYHSMKKPDETLMNSCTDVVLKSNHVDFALMRLIPEIANNKDWRLTCSVEGLAIRINAEATRSTGNFVQVEPLDRSPLIDRELVQWKNYAFENAHFVATTVLS